MSGHHHAYSIEISVRFTGYRYGSMDLLISFGNLCKYCKMSFYFLYDTY